METTNSPELRNPYLHNAIWNLLFRYPKGTLLDLPSGPGYFARRAQEEGYASIAGEIDEHLHVFPNVTYRKVDMASAFPFEDCSFDYLVSIEGIEHIENQLLFLRECRRVLKEGGILFLTTPNVSSLESRFIFLFTGVHETPPKPLAHNPDNPYQEHINLIPFHRLEGFLRLAGFNVVSVLTDRYEKGGRFLYYILYPFIYLRMRQTFIKHYKGSPDEAVYRRIMALHLKKEVLCGSSHIIVAEKPKSHVP